MKPITRYVLIAIVTAALFLRLWDISQVPPGVNRDEASIGITAYSLMMTGKDEYGRMLPISFESFGDWKLPLYIYTVIPFIKLMGLTELAVRIPSVLAGIGSVVVIFYLARLLFASEFIALAAAFSLAVMPWHVHISRVESEAIVSVFFTLVGSLQFFIGIRNKSIASLIASAVFFSLTYWTYHGTHVSTTLLLLGMAAIFWKDIVRVPRYWWAIGVGAIITLTIFGATFQADHTKISGISIFGDPTVVHNNIELPRTVHEQTDTLATRLLHNKFTYATRTVIHNYLSSYGPEFLFIKGGGNRAHNIAGYGNLHVVEAPLLLIGIAWLIAAIKKKEAKFILWWLAIGGVAAAITKDAPHSNRMLAVVPALSVTAAWGYNALVSSVNRSGKKLMILAVIAGYLVCMAIYLDLYFVHFKKTEAMHWGYGYKTLTSVLFSPENRTKQVIMTKPETSPYSYILFYSGYHPAEYQKTATRYPISSDGFTDVSGFGRFAFRAIDWQKDLGQKNTLLVVSPEEFSDALSPKVTATIRLPDNSVQFIVVDTDK